MYSRTLIGLEQEKNKFRKFLYILKNNTLKNLHSKLQQQNIKLREYFDNEKDFVTTKCRLLEKIQEQE